MKTNIIFGRQPVFEALKSGIPVKEVILQIGAHGDAIDEIINVCKRKKIRVRTMDARYFSDMIGGKNNHQGAMVLLDQKEFQYVEMDVIFDRAVAAGEKPLVAILDEITDPHNLGAIIRSAECAGFHGVVIPKHRSAEVNATVVKTSAGATAYIPVVQVTNLTQALEELQERGVWIYGTSLDGDRDYDAIDARDAVGIVIGSEGKGMRKMVAEHCDFLIRIPMSGQIQSLNASVAAGIVFFDVMRQRRKGK